MGPACLIHNCALLSSLLVRLSSNRLCVGVLSALGRGCRVRHLGWGAHCWRPRERAGPRLHVAHSPPPGCRAHVVHRAAHRAGGRGSHGGSSRGFSEPARHAGCSPRPHAVAGWRERRVRAAQISPPAMACSPSPLMPTPPTPLPCSAAGALLACKRLHRLFYSEPAL